MAAAFVLFDRQAVLRIMRFVKLWWTLKDPDAYVSELHYQRRLITCERCPVFFKPLRTCGTPLKKDLRGIGCYCFMEAKAKLTHATCWLDDELGPNPDGWTVNAPADD